MKYSFSYVAFVALLCCGIAACANRPTADILRPVTANDIGTQIPLLVATTRARSVDDPNQFTWARSDTLNYHKYKISVPPNHNVGHIEYPNGVASDPNTMFLVTQSDAIDFSGMKSALSIKSNPDGKLVIFIHGYNTNFEEALFRAVQLKHDLDFQSAGIAFIWPSRGRVGDYLSDRDSATYSRDYLQRFLDDIAAMPSVKQINIVAHSMGNWLTVETIRQAKMGGHSRFLGKLHRVLLTSPDIDIDVFRTEMEAIGRLSPPITVLTSDDDYALLLSQNISGDVPRLGSLPQDDPRISTLVQKFGLSFVDLSKFEGIDATNHSKYASVLPEIMQKKKETNEVKVPDILKQPGTFLYDGAGRLLQLPFDMLQKIH